MDNSMHRAYSKAKSKADRLFEACKSGAINTKMFKDITGRTIRIDGKANYSRYSGRALREIRAKQAREAIYGHALYADGTIIDESKIIDLCV